MSDRPGGEPRDERIETNPDANLAEVLRDDALLDVIGSSRPSAWSDLPDDEVTRLLTAWQADAAAYAAARTRPPVDAPAAPVTEVVPQATAAVAIATRRRHARPRQGRRAPRSAAAITAAAVAGAVLSVGGVAAAVTGSPLTPLRAVVSGLAPAAQDDGSDIRTAMPRELANVRTAIREGHLDEARRKLTDVREQAETLDPPDRVEAMDEITVLEEELAEHSTPQPSGTGTDSPRPSANLTDSGPPSSSPTPKPSDTASPTPSPTGPAEPTPSASETSKGNGVGKARSPAQPEPPRGARYDGGSSS
jgi:Anti-sigma-D factor RsdA to sigma factor binding region